MSDQIPFQSPGHARATVISFLRSRYAVDFRVVDANTPQPPQSDWRAAACQKLTSKKRIVVCHDAIRHPAAADTVLAAMMVSPRAKVGSVYAFPYSSTDGSTRATLCGIGTKAAVGPMRLDTRLARILVRFLAGIESAGRAATGAMTEKPKSQSSPNRGPKRRGRSTNGPDTMNMSFAHAT